MVEELVVEELVVEQEPGLVGVEIRQGPP